MKNKKNLWGYLPTKEQWSSWSLPSKYGAIGVALGVAGIMVGLLPLFFSPSAGGSDPGRAIISAESDRSSIDQATESTTPYPTPRNEEQEPDKGHLFYDRSLASQEYADLSKLEFHTQHEHPIEVATIDKTDATRAEVEGYESVRRSLRRRKYIHLEVNMFDLNDDGFFDFLVTRIGGSHGDLLEVHLSDAKSVKWRRIEVPYNLYHYFIASSKHNGVRDLVITTRDIEASEAIIDHYYLYYDGQAAYRLPDVPVTASQENVLLQEPTSAFYNEHAVTIYRIYAGPPGASE